jgi:thiol-disulfide isomerase/thioredoxin
MKSKLFLSFISFLALNVFIFSQASAKIVELKGKITLVDGGGMPATAIMHSTADEGYIGTANIDKDGNFSFKVDVPKATLFNLRVMHLSYDIMLSAKEKTTTMLITFDNDRVKESKVENSRENDAYTLFKSVQGIYIPKLRSHFTYCEKEDSCEKELHILLTEYAHELSIIQQNFKGTYTADVLCKMRMPSIAKNPKNTAEEFRKNFFENIDFSDSTIFSTPVYKDMLGEYVDFLKEPRISKEAEFIKYYTEKIKANAVVLHKSAGMLFEELVRKQKEKMLELFIAWYNTGNNKAMVNNPVLDVRLKNISKVMPGQRFIDITAPDTAGIARTLKEVVDKSKCTLLLFWSSECSHCRDEMPFIKEYYEKYHGKGLGIYAVSLESDPMKWKTFVQEQKLPWTNVITSRSADPNPAMQYMSVSTPTVVLIDNTGAIIHRFIPKNKIEDHIIEALK